jgi:uncharacterized protein (TIGR03067 family)
MTRKPLLTLTLAFAASTLAFADDKPKPKDSGAPADLIGGYTIVAGEKYGEKESAERIEGVTVRIAEDAIIVLDKEKKEVYAQTYKIDTTSTPWKITLKSKITPYKEAKGGDSEESIAQGLIEKDGDTVKLIYALPGTPAPTEFKTKSKQLMFVMKNERKETTKAIRNVK